MRDNHYVFGVARPPSPSETQALRAEVARLREALREIMGLAVLSSARVGHAEAVKIAEAALRSAPTPEQKGA